METKILHLGDIHFGRGEKEKVNLITVVDRITRDFAGKEITILIAGDIVDDGQKRQFRKAREIMEPLFQNFQVLSVPGNHDYGWNGNHAVAKRYKYFKRYFHGIENVTYPHVKPLPGGHVHIGLNSMKAEDGFWDGLLADGELGHRQIHSLSGVLGQLENRDREKQKVIVHLHHHPFIYPDEGKLMELGEKIAHWLKDGQALMHVLAGRVDVLMFGHEHRHLDFSSSDLKEKYKIPVILSAGKCTEYAEEYRVNQAGDATTEKLHEGLLGRLITIPDQGQVHVETVVFAEQS